MSKQTHGALSTNSPPNLYLITLRINCCCELTMHEDVSGVKTLLLLICVNKTVANGTKLLTVIHKIGYLFMSDSTKKGEGG